MKRLDYLLRHINHVATNCEILGRKLIEQGEQDVGLRLIANGRSHDASKFFGIEFKFLNDNVWPRPEEDVEGFKLALHQHVTTNPHHPECWAGIENVPRVYLGECLADWAARSAEQGTDLAEWVKEKATEKFKFSTRGRVYKELREFMELLLERKM